jgi:hypothetical protein
MARTFLRQDTQIRNSDLYDDTLAVGVTLESGQTTIEGDLNAVRSQAKRALWADSVGNWYDDINTPVTLDPGTKRGLRDLNSDLHLLERKRVLVSVANLTDIVVPAAASATGSFNSTGAFANGETITIGTQTYTFTSPFVNAANNIDASGTVAQTHENLRRAINGNGIAGTNYGTGTPVNTDVTATDGATSNTFTAVSAGTWANTVVLSTTAANATVSGATLTGGAGDVVVFTAPQLPANTTAAIGVVTTRGTVAAQNTTFGSHSLAEVAGTTAVAPKNIVEIVDGQTRDEILSSNRVIYALFQTESATDGSTMTGTTPNRAMISFVRLNAAGDDLERVPATHIAGRTINYASVERKALEDLNEQDFLRGAILDNLGSTTVTRQVAYDNQGTTPVDLTTNATLDLEGAGLVWKIRDDLQADLFVVTEGSAGGTSEVQIATDVDTFNVDAAVNDFDQGIRVDTGGQRINIGETAGLIESTSTNDLRVLGAGELYLDDGNQSGSTWAQTAGIKLSDTTQEWDDFETAYGEVSILRALYLAANPPSSRGTKVYANVTVTTPANGNVSLADSNLDVALPDMSGGSFLTDYDVFLNGELLRPGADSSANNDYYPGTALTPAAQLKFEFTVKQNDVICVIPYA